MEKAYQEEETSVDAANYQRIDNVGSFEKIASMTLIMQRSRDFFRTLKPTFHNLQSCCSTVALIVCLLLLIFSLLAIVFKPTTRTVHVLIFDTDQPPIPVVNPKFLSFALDSSIIAHAFKGFNLTNPRLIKLLAPLAPAYFRIGGTMADRLWFGSNETVPFKSTISEIDGGECANEYGAVCSQDRPNFTMSEKEWIDLNHLATKAGVELIFDLNVLIRHDNGSWNPKNARRLIDFSSQHNFNLHWELGNEPHDFKKVFNFEVKPTQLAKDYKLLKDILNEYPIYQNSLLVGPATNKPVPRHNESEVYLRKFLKTGAKTINAVTWHQYYVNGKTATSKDFLSTKVLDILINQIDIIKQVVQSETPGQKMPIWLGETASAYGGGAPGLSDRFIATFMWVDKLGIAAKLGLDLVVRQSIFKGYYALVDDYLNPTPDWWVSVLYKRLVGPEVFPCEFISSPFVRLYCHCTKKLTATGTVPSVTVFGFNLNAHEASVKFDGLIPTGEEVKVDTYVLTSYLSLMLKYIQLNDQFLELYPNGDLPPMRPRVVIAKPYVVLPPYSVVFWKVSHPSFQYCKNAM